MTNQPHFNFYPTRDVLPCWEGAIEGCVIHTSHHVLGGYWLAHIITPEGGYHAALGRTAQLSIRNAWAAMEFFRAHVEKWGPLQ